VSDVSNPVLYLLDGMALLYRSHFVFINNPIRNSKGVNTSAAYGFTNTLVELLNKQNPTHIGVAFDTDVPTARHKTYPQYKAQREEMPEELADAIPVVKDLLHAFNIPILEVDGYEADDVIGTLARIASANNFQTFMVTPDKDFGQLVDERTFIYRPGRQGGDVEIWDVEMVCRKWGVDHPDQVVDCLGMIGDSVDNIPGIPGIGPKTAEKLLSQFGSLEELLDNVDQLQGKQKEKVANHAEQARLSKQLAKIDVSVPLDLSLNELQRCPWNENRLKTLFIELEFNSLGKRLFGDEFHAGRGAEAVSTVEPQRKNRGETSPKSTQASIVADFKTIDDFEKAYHVVSDTSSARAFLKELKKQKAFAFDTETSGLNPRESELIGISFSWNAHSGWWVPAGQLSALSPQLSALFSAPDILKIAHNAKFDLAVLRAFDRRSETHPTGSGQPVATTAAGIFDTMIAHALCFPDQKHSMDALSESLLGYRPISITSLIGAKGKDQQTMLEADPDGVARYAIEDADVTFQLYEKLLPLLKEKEQEDIFFQIEMPALPALEQMESAGVELDLFALEDFSQQLALKISKAKEEIETAAGTSFNLNSPRQLGVILFENLKLVAKPKKTKTGQYKTDEATLQTLSGLHPIIDDILAYRMMTKLKSTYVDALPNAVSPRTGRIHTTYHQAATSTGRLASSDPNLQNIPIRTELGREIRKAFVAGPGKRLLAADYSQIELRIIAAISNDSTMIQAFNHGLDIHAATAARVYGVGPEAVDPEMRRKAKMVNFGISYGISAFGLAQRLAIPRTEAADIIDNYFHQFPGIKTYIEETIQFCVEHGYVETLSGRRRYLPDIRSSNKTVKSAAERNAINMPIQGTAADLIKIAMAHIHQDLQENEFRSLMLLQVHDELIFEVVPEEEGALRERIETRMVNALPALNQKVKVEVEIGTGKNWLQAH